MNSLLRGLSGLLFVLGIAFVGIAVFSVTSDIRFSTDRDLPLTNKMLEADMLVCFLAVVLLLSSIRARQSATDK